MCMCISISSTDLDHIIHTKTSIKRTHIHTYMILSRWITIITRIMSLKNILLSTHNYIYIYISADPAYQEERAQRRLAKANNVRIEPHSCKILFFYRFWTQRLTLKIIPTQVEKRCPWARQAMLFPCSGASLFGKAFGSEVAVLPVVTPKRNGRCQRCISKAIGGANWAPAAKSSFFIGSGCNVWHWRAFQRRSKNGVLELARPCYFPVPGRAFLGRLLGQKSWFCPSWRPNATEGANGAFRRQLEVQIEPHSCKIFFFYRFWTQRLTLKIIPTQVEKRCPWARQAMLFPCSGASLFWQAFGSEVVVLPVVTPKRNGRCQRCISKAIGGANWAPQLQNPLFLYIGSGRNVWHWRSFQRRSKNGVLELARPCCFPVPGRAFLGRLLGQKSWFCPSWRPNATEGANGAFRRH